MLVGFKAVLTYIPFLPLWLKRVTYHSRVYQYFVMTSGQDCKTCSHGRIQLGCHRLAFSHHCMSKPLDRHPSTFSFAAELLSESSIFSISQTEICYQERL